MSRRAWLALCSIVVLTIAAIATPPLREYVYFERSLASAEEEAQANAGNWPRLSDSCTNCHGRNGDSVNQAYADLASQPAHYVAAQLHAFAEGRRNSPFMTPLASSLSDAEIQRVSEYFSRQPATDNDAFVPDPVSRARGETLASGCVACHGERLMGDGTRPRLAGQGYDYLIAQMGAFADNTRRDPSGAMNTLAASLSTDDRRALSAYVASYPVMKRDGVR